MPKLLRPNLVQMQTELQTHFLKFVVCWSAVTTSHWMSSTSLRKYSRRHDERFAVIVMKLAQINAND
jgi:hypothetical protein